MAQTRDIFVLLSVFAAGTALGLWLQSSPASPIAGATVAGTSLWGISAAPQRQVQTVFSPSSEARIVAEINSASSTLDVMLYQFSSSAAKEAIVNAVGRGVRVRLILEPRVDSNIATAEFLNSKGVQVRWASLSYTNTHAKTMVADGKRVLVGSINWSRQALSTNREAAVIVSDGAIAGEFLEVFNSDWEKAGAVK